MDWEKVRRQYGCLTSVIMQCVPMTVRMLREAGVMLIVVCGARGAVPAWWTVWTQDLGWRGKAAAALGNTASA